MGLEAWDIKRLNSHLWNIQVILWHSTCIIPLQYFTMFMYYTIYNTTTFHNDVASACSPSPFLFFLSSISNMVLVMTSKNWEPDMKIVFTPSLSTSTNTLSTYGGNFSTTHSNTTWKAIFWRPFFIRQNAPSFFSCCLKWRGSQQKYRKHTHMLKKVPSQ